MVFHFGTNGFVQATRKSIGFAYCVFTRTLCEGLVPAWRDECGYPFVYTNENEAQREIALHQLGLIQEFLKGEREFDDALTVEDFVLPVNVWPDGSVSLLGGTRYEKLS